MEQQVNSSLLSLHFHVRAITRQLQLTCSGSYTMQQELRVFVWNNTPTAVDVF